MAKFFLRFFGLGLVVPEIRSQGLRLQPFYIKFFADRWVGMLFIPYPYATGVEAPVVTRVFEAARKQTGSAALMKGKFDLLSEAATIQIERYGYLEDRIVFECGSLAPCTIKMGDGFLELIKPGVINEHIVRYSHVATP